MNTKNEGVISEIERYAIKDGPGIRTVVFLKGCPLKCRWCANPETQKSIYQLMYWPNRCIACKQCILECPNNALSWGNPGIQICRADCASCGACTQICNSQALTMAGQHKTADEIMQIILKDLPYYQTSGGGVTFSGGEAASQGEFLCKLAKECKKHRISTCIETCGYAKWEIFCELLPYIDYFFYDLKIIDEKDHMTYTGVSNKLILDNFSRLIQAKADVTVRIPVIPGINNTQKNVEQTIRFLLEQAPGCPVSLLPYHRLGASKYDKLDMEYTLAELAPPSEKEMFQLKEQFVSFGFPVRIGE
ncbi:MAG: glycyl-radical enzyme activating protein [Dorea sp.]|nr:glycyl-radical enzyme activating protein [Dorea sp.]